MILVQSVDPTATSLQWEISTVANRYHVNCLDKKSGLRGSGYAQSIATAKKKAFVELNERGFYSQIRTDEAKRKAWGLDFDDSCSGFAAGYSQANVIRRALHEASERWALSKWMDGGMALPHADDTLLSEASKKIAAHFSSYSLYRQAVMFSLNGYPVVSQIAVALAWTSEGVFAGYGAKPNFSDAVDHAFVESMRNHLIHKNQIRRSSFPYNRIHFFAMNRHVGERAIQTQSHTPRQTQTNWPTPTLKVLKVERFGEIWLARAIFDGWTPWQLGPIERFLY